MVLAIVGICILLVIYIIFIYNSLVSLRQRVNQAFGDIDVQLRQRHDLIPNLVETVKSYATHERETLDSVTQARQMALNAQSSSEQSGAEQLLTGALGRLLAVAESYPELKASQNFQQMQADLTNIENKLAAARRFFNNAVSEYNATIESFPAVLVARKFGFTHRGFFDVGEAQRQLLHVPPSVKF